MPPDQFLVFLTLTFVVSASPGPVMLACMAFGGRFGLARTCYGMLGATGGNLLLVGFSFAGMGLLLEGSERLFTIIRWAGAAYLVWLGLRLWRPTSGDFNEAATPDEGAPARLFLSGFLIAATNPKGLIYFGALFPQFVSLERPLLPQFALLTSVFMLTDFVWMFAYAKGGDVIMHWLRNPEYQGWFNRITGSALMLTGILMAVM